jgi:hypothetical protein
VNRLPGEPAAPTANARGLSYGDIGRAFEVPRSAVASACRRYRSRSRTEGDKCTERRQGPSNCRELSFAVEWAEDEADAEPKSAHRSRRTAGALGYRVLSGSEFRYKIKPQKKDRIR